MVAWASEHLLPGRHLLQHARLLNSCCCCSHCELRVDVIAHTTILAPIPLRQLIEDSIVGDIYLPYSWIIGAITLGSRLIPNKHHLGALIFKLLEMWLGVLDVDNATERAQVLDTRLPPMPGFIRHSPLDTPCRRAVQQIDYCGDCLSPEVAGQVLRFHHATCDLHDGLIPAFHHVILLWRIWRGELAP
jgi:hypothetical protein